MAYFQDHHAALHLMQSIDGSPGFRRNQVGGISAAVAHFTVSHETALICMPTGSGKTAVLMALCFALRAGKVLIITPSQLVRNQIAEDFQQLEVLKRIGVLPESLPTPSVKEVTSRVASDDEWSEVLKNDVVVATPNSVSPGVSGVATAPPTAFDLVIMDEAHHSAASSWAKLLEHFSDARRVLLTATPFRNDGKEIKAKIVYNYPLRKAHEDGIFGKLSYIPVTPSIEERTDIEIAQSVEDVYRRDASEGFDHRIIIRTDRKSRADELKELYDQHTSLNLKVVNSSHSVAHIKKIIDQLRKGEVDGVIAVDMLGEGFDLPTLKIAAIHSPHKSLAITLQFIGRFARTNGEKVGEAKFIAAINENMEVERLRLFQQEAAWLELIQSISEDRIGREIDAQAFFSQFVPVWGENQLDVSLYSFQPNCHVKIYKVHGSFKLKADMRSENFPVVFHNASDVHNTAVLLWVNTQKPKWIAHGSLNNHNHELLVVHYHPDSKLLFICSTLRQNELYDRVVEAYVGGNADMIPLCRLKRVMAGWKEARFFNVGMRSRKAMVGAESYKVIMGSSAHDAIQNSDGLNYVRGHSYGKGIDEDGEPIMIGMSSSSKLWSSEYFQIQDLVEWCGKLARKINDPACDTMDTPLGQLDSGEQVDTLPLKALLAGDWDVDSYSSERRVVLTCADGAEVTYTLPELMIVVDPARSNNNQIVFSIGTAKGAVDFEFTLNPVAYKQIPGPTNLELLHGFLKKPLASYLLENSPVFYYEDLSSLHRDLYFDGRLDLAPFDVSKAEPFDWVTANVCIHSEEKLKDPLSGKLTIHEHFRNTLPADFDVVIYDQGSGEIADLVGMRGGADPRIVLYHCKGTKEAAPGDRVDDMYEVCGQAVKSVVWANRTRLAQKIKKERASREYLKGDKAKALTILDLFASQALPLEIVVVQPGLASATLPKSRKMADLLGAVENHLETHAGAKFRVICS